MLALKLLNEEHHAIGNPFPTVKSVFTRFPRIWLAKYAVRPQGHGSDSKGSGKVRGSVNEKPCRFFDLRGSVEEKRQEKVRYWVGFGAGVRIEKRKSVAILRLTAPIFDDLS